jgi:hypothetical protein
LSTLLHLAPFLLVLLLIARGRYPGERRVVALAGRGRARGRGPKPSHPVRPRVHATFARHGALLASSLAGRGPPARCPL